MITTVNSASALNAALKTAQAGDTIQLAAGTYAGVSAQNLHFAQDVTITSVGPVAAVITSLQVNSSNGITFTNLEMQANAAGGDYPFQINGSHDIHFDHLNIHGSLDSNPQNDVSGVLVRSSSDVSITNSEVQQLKNGLVLNLSDHVTISGNTLHDIRVDGIHSGGSSWVTISGNSLHDFYSMPGDHSDAIQFQTGGTTTAAHDITIIDNLYVRGAGTPAQGIFMNDEVGTLHYQHVLIANNFMIGTQYNGIAVANPDDITIKNNTVVGFDAMKSWITIAGGDGAVISGNTTNLVKTAGETSVTQTGTIIIPVATDAGAAVYQQWLALHPAAGAPPPPTGGLVLTGGAGADSLVGGLGADTLTGGGGSDVLAGGAGDDTYAISSKSSVVEIAGGGHDTVLSSASGFTLPVNIEDLVITATYGVYGSGNDLDNRLTGGIGGDHLSGGGGADTIDGGAGADFLSGGGGADKLTGGVSADTFVYLGRDGADVITDFGAGGEHDVIDLSALLNAGAHPVLSESAAGVTITITPTDTILLQGLHLASLHATATGYIF